MNPVRLSIASFLYFHVFDFNPAKTPPSSSAPSQYGIPNPDEKRIASSTEGSDPSSTSINGSDGTEAGIFFEGIDFCVDVVFVREFDLERFRLTRESERRDGKLSDLGMLRLGCILVGLPLSIEAVLACLPVLGEISEFD